MKLLTISLAIIISLSASAQNANPTAQYNKAKNGLAIEGYDPVAYFTQNKALEGKKELAVSYQSIIYYFASTENKQMFSKNPSAYVPQYGGWCAFAMGSTGEKVAIDPETFKVKDGKLYLFYNKYFNNTLKSWNKDESNLHTKADANWQRLNKQ